MNVCINFWKRPRKGLGREVAVSLCLGTVPGKASYHFLKSSASNMMWALSSVMSLCFDSCQCDAEEVSAVFRSSFLRLSDLNCESVVCSL